MGLEQKYTVETEVVFQWELEAAMFFHKLTEEQQIKLCELISRFLRKKSGSYGFILKHEGKDVYGEVDIEIEDGDYRVYNVMPITLDEYLDLKDKVL